MRIVCLSDTHELHRSLIVPPGDLLLHAGDFTFFGRGSEAIRDFNTWLGELPHRHKIITVGNHEHLFESHPNMRPMINNAILLINEAIVVDGVKIWGTPLTPHYGGAFGTGNASVRQTIYAEIPPDIDILLTHGPPFGILDQSPSDYPGPAGDPELRTAVIRVKPALHVFGHIHSGYGIRPTRHTLFVNAALFGIDGTLDKRPIVLEMSRFKSKT